MLAAFTALVLAGLVGQAAPIAVHPSDGLVLLQTGVRLVPGHNATDSQGASDVSLERFVRVGLSEQGEAVHVVSSRPRALLMAYICSMITVATCITLIYWHKGMGVICSILVYLFALSTMKLSVKWVFSVNGFEYPTFVTATHMLASTTVGFLILLKRTITDGRPLVYPNAREWFFQIVPLSSSIAISLASNNIALLFCSASFAEIIASTTPIVAVGMILLKGMPFHMSLLGPTCLVVFGCALSVVGELHFSLMGFILCFVSNAGRALKVVLQQELMTGATKEKFDPCTLLAWMCLSSFLIMIVWSSASEGLAPYRYFADREKAMPAAAAILVACVNAVILNLAALFVTKELGAVGGQLVAQTKSVLTVLGGIVVFHDSFSAQEVVGFATVLAGTYLYSTTEKRLNQK